MSDWIVDILQIQPKFIPVGLDSEEFLHFAAVVFENIWRSRNEARLSGDSGNWPLISRRILSSAKLYWHASFNRQKPILSSMSEHWELPPAGWLKYSVDAAVFQGKAWSACISRNHLGRVEGAWVSKGNCSNVFSAELRAFLLAF